MFTDVKRVVLCDEVTDAAVSAVRVFEPVAADGLEGPQVGQMVRVLRPGVAEFTVAWEACRPRRGADGWVECMAPAGEGRTQVQYPYWLVRMTALQDREGHETAAPAPQVYAVLPADCLTLDAAPGAYYVSMQEGSPDGAKGRVLYGPFGAHLAALSAVQRVKAFLADKGPLESTWWRIGTARTEPGAAPAAPGPLNQAIDAWMEEEEAARVEAEEERRAAGERPSVYFVVDDVIDEAGREGFELMHGDAQTATGYSVHRGHTLSECIARVPAGDPVYRVKLARRHGEFSCKLIEGGARASAEPAEGPSL